MKRPTELEQGTQVNFFVKNIEPAWEDPANAKGGRYQLRIPSTPNQPFLSNKLWEDLVLGLVGEQFTYPDEINGIVLNIKKKFNIISVWNKSGKDLEIRNTIKSDLIKILGVPPHTKLEYQQFSAEEH